MGRSVTTVVAAWHTWNEEGGMHRDRGSGARRRTTNRQERHLRLLALQSGMSSTRAVVGACYAAIGKLLRIHRPPALDKKSKAGSQDEAATSQKYLEQLAISQKHVEEQVATTHKQVEEQLQQVKDYIKDIVREERQELGAAERSLTSAAPSFIDRHSVVTQQAKEDFTAIAYQVQRLAKRAFSNSPFEKQEYVAARQFVEGIVDPDVPRIM
nr:unnamed protein product [Callosobruchus chinensis]